MRSKLEGNSLGECASIVQEQERSTPTNAAWVSIPTHQRHYACIWLGFVVDSLLCSTSFFSRCSS